MSEYLYTSMIITHVHILYSYEYLYASIHITYLIIRKFDLYLILVAFVGLTVNILSGLILGGGLNCGTPGGDSGVHGYVYYMYV
jgi:hypothetical protein